MISLIKSYSISLIAPYAIMCKIVLPTLSAIIGSAPFYINKSKESRSSLAAATWIAAFPLISLTYIFGFPNSIRVLTIKGLPLRIA